MDPNRKYWNQQQQLLNRALDKSDAGAVDLVLAQHAMVHSAEMSGAGLWSFEDEVWDGLTPDAARNIPAKAEHSIAWMTWHVTRCEDITLNLLAAGMEQVLHGQGWQARLGVSDCDTGSLMTPEQITVFSSAINLDALRGYRLAVGRRTREIVGNLAPGVWQRTIDPARLARVYDEGAVLQGANWLVDYWGAHAVAGLLRMPATRHPFVHWNEALKVRGMVKQRSG